MSETPKATVKHELSEFKNSHWTLLMGQSVERGPRRPRSEATLSDHETKRREAVWELFHSEVIYLMSHLLVLKEVFLEPLKEIQQMGHLQHVDVNKIFCNLEELCEVSTRFAKNLMQVFQSEQPTQFGSTASVVSAFTEVSIPFITLSLLSTVALILLCLTANMVLFLVFSSVGKFIPSIRDTV